MKQRPVAIILAGAALIALGLTAAFLTDSPDFAGRHPELVSSMIWIMLPALFIGLLVILYGTTRWAQTANPGSTAVAGALVLLAVFALSKLARVSVHDWTAFLAQLFVVAGLTGIVLVLVGAVRWVRDQDGWLTRR